MLQNVTPLRKSAPGPPNSSDEDVSCYAPATENACLQILSKCPTPAIVFGHATKPSPFCSFLRRCTIPCACHTKAHLNLQKWREHVVFCTFCFAPQRRALFGHLNSQKWSEHGVFCTFWLRNVLCATTACTFSTAQLLKVLRSWSVLYILTSKCASRHNGVHFLDISTPKSGPNMVCFVHFDFETCFAPQRRALFRHRNFQKWSEPGVFRTFWLRNVLCATTACTFSTAQLLKVLRSWSVLYILTSKCASRHNGVHFFISHLASWLRARRFSEPTFRPSGATNSVSRLSYLFARLDLLSSDSFSSLIFCLLLFSSLWLFPSLLFICPYCRKFDF